MIDYEGMKAEESKKGFDPLPAGPYVGKIMNVKIDGTDPDQTLVIRLDVIEGEHAGYFTRRYQHDQEAGGQYEVRYKGDYKLRIPNPRNTNARYPDSDKRRFNDLLWRVEKSNPGYHWDGDETKLKGKIIGFSMQDDEYNGAKFTRIARMEIADDVRKGLIKVMDPRPPRSSGAVEVPAAPAPAGDGFTQVEVELPF